MSMKIHANAYPVPEGSAGNLKANVTFVLGDQIRVSGARLVEGEKGMFLAMPSYEKFDGTYQDICHATTKEFRDVLQQVALQAYESDNHFWIKNGKTNPTIKAAMNEYVNESRNVYGIGRMTFGGEFAIEGLQVKKVQEGERAGKLFVAFPTDSYEKDGETKYRRIVEGKDVDTHGLMQNLALKAYKEKIVEKEQAAEMGGKESVEEKVAEAQKKAEKPKEKKEAKKKEPELVH